VFGLVVVCVLALDQVSKYLVRANLEPGDAIALIPGLLGITYVRNIGGAFGVLAGFRMLFIGVMVLVVLGVAVYWYRTRPRFTWLCVSLGLVTAGALGNAIDRLDTGLVTDFIDVFGRYWPVFNVADSAIVVGVGMLLIWVILAPEEQLAADAEAAATEVEHG
jgi:signal peptidase II